MLRQTFTFEPESRLIQADHELDLATYDFSEVTANAVGVDVHFAPAWPPIVLDGDVGIVGGWPWSLSSAEIGTVAHQFLHFAVRLQVHSADGIGAAVFTSTSIPWGENALPLGTNLGGMSGGPVFRLVAEPIMHLRLVGIVYEYHTEFELILARPLTLVASDGSIGRREHDV